MLVTPIYNGDELRDEFRHFERGEQFSREAFAALYAYLDELSDDIGEDIHLDVIGICCEWSEYDSVEEACAEYGENFETLDDLSDHTHVLMLDSGGVVIRDF